MAASAPKQLKRLGMAAMSSSDMAATEYDPPAIPLDPSSLAQAVFQLQNTVNELIARHNQLCTDASHAGDQVTGAGAAATNLFTAN